MGRPPILSPARLRQARLQAGQGLTHAGIGLRLGVSRSWISELIRQHGTLPAPGTLFEDTGAAGAGPPSRGGTAPGQHAGPAGGGGEQDAGNGDGPGTGGRPAGGGTGAGQGSGGSGDDRTSAESGGEGASWQVARRIESGTVACRYAGATLVHAFTSRIGAQGLLAAGTGAPADDLGILMCTQMSFTLGALTLESSSLRRARSRPNRLVMSPGGSAAGSSRSSPRPCPGPGGRQRPAAVRHQWLMTVRRGALCPREPRRYRQRGT
jgi:hypothetical protein